MLRLKSGKPPISVHTCYKESRDDVGTSSSHVEVLNRQELIALLSVTSGKCWGSTCDIIRVHSFSRALFEGFTRRETLSFETQNTVSVSTQVFSTPDSFKVKLIKSIDDYKTLLILNMFHSIFHVRIIAGSCKLL